MDNLVDGSSTWVGHALVQAGGVSAVLAPRPLPLEPRLVVHDAHVAVLLVGAHVRLLLHHHHRPLEEVLASAEILMIIYYL